MDRETVSNAQWTRFFNALSKCESVSKALNKAKINRSTAYRAYKNDTWIREQWDNAIQAGTEYLEDAGISRAIDGVVKEKGIYYEGRLISIERETKFSDTIWLAAMQARDRRYRNNTNERVQELVLQELSMALEKLRRVLSSEVYELVVQTLASDDDVIDVTPKDRTFAIEDNSSSETL